MSWTSHHREREDSIADDVIVDVPSRDNNYSGGSRVCLNAELPIIIRSADCRQQHPANPNSFFTSSRFCRAENNVDRGNVSCPLMSNTQCKLYTNNAFGAVAKSATFISVRQPANKILANLVFTETMNKSDVISLSWNGCLLASGGADKSIRVYEVCKSSGDDAGSSCLPSTSCNNGVREVTEIFLLERSFSPITEAHRYHVNSVAFFPDTDKTCETPLNDPILASCSTDGILCLWNARDGTKLASVRHPFKTQAPLRICRFSPCGLFIASAGDDEKIAVWKLSKIGGNGAQEAVQLDLYKCFIGPNERTVTSLAFTPDSTVLLSGASAGASSSGDLRAWGVTGSNTDQQNTKELFIERDAHDLGVTCCDMSAHWLDEKLRVAVLVTGGYDNVLKIWHVYCNDTKSGTLASIRLHMQLTGHTADICDCRLSHANVAAEQLVVSASNDRSLIIWSLATGAPLAVVDGFARFVRCVCFSPDDKYVASGDGSGRVAIFALKNTIRENASVRNDASTSSSSVMMPPPTYDQAVGMKSGNKRNSIASEIGRQNVRTEGEKHAAISRLKSLPAVGVCEREKDRQQAVRSRANTYDSQQDNCVATISPSYLCPITHSLMQDPVVAADGFTYDRRAIEALFAKPESLADGTLLAVLSPLTGIPFSHQVLIPNRTLGLMIDTFKQSMLTLDTNSDDRQNDVLTKNGNHGLKK